ncbi:hypothetical protein RhiJN_25267 [Ceratobasidium sp. AG-Ba]|nr:hypothetical protein RhiJN_25267 [Ceratobasidium sp. AG-Ba]
MLIKSHSCPYFTGARFHLQVTCPTGAVFKVRATVVHTYTPFTISPVIKLSIDHIVPGTPNGFDNFSTGLPSEVILKVFDRRFAHELRAYYKGKPVTFDSEQAYQDYLATGPAEDIPKLAEEIKTLIGPKFRYKDAPQYLFEHFITLTMSPYFEDECAVYQQLVSLQGHDIPIFYGVTRFIDGLIIPDLNPPVEGVLLEVVPGIGLDKIDPSVVNLDAAISDAMRIVRDYTRLGLLNMDVRLGNFIIKPSGKLILIDFAQSRLREEDETDEEWWQDKKGQDELGRVCFQTEIKYGRPWDPNLLNIREAVEVTPPGSVMLPCSSKVSSSENDTL